MLRLTIFLVIVAFAAVPTNGLNSRKLDDTTTPPPDLDNKCGGCPCDNPCNQAPPPPPPPSPPPPPPPPKHKPPPSNDCPPPPCEGSCNPTGPTPPSGYIYITGPPGNLYPVDPYYSGADQGLLVGFPLLISSLFLVVQAFL